jgi:hypothetical protein
MCPQIRNSTTTVIEGLQQLRFSLLVKNCIFYNSDAQLAARGPDASQGLIYSGPGRV